jgi:hypothetical protein
VKPLLVGEDNPYGSDPRYALFPIPIGSAGHRLRAKILGVTLGSYLRDFDRVNLCSLRWRAEEAREKAYELTMLRDKLVLLGAKVARAFGMKHVPFSYSKLPSGMYEHERMVVQLPHPSGRCRLWNEPGAFERARAVLREAGVLP